MDEAEHWSKVLRPKFIRECQKLKLRHNFHRIENAVIAGTFDLNFLVDGVEGWIELKYGDRLPTSLDAKVLGREKGLRRSQITWCTARTWAGGRMFVGVGCPDNWWLMDVRGYRPEDLDDIQHWSVATLNRNACWRANHDSWGTLPITLIGESPGRGGISSDKQE